MPDPVRHPLDDLSWPVRTERLTLRRGRPDDAAAVFAYRSLGEVGRWLTRIQTDPHAWEENWAQRLSTTVVAECGGELIGDMRLVIQDAHAQGEVQPRAVGVEAELMWAFDPDWRGQGYATEAVACLIRLAFDELGLRRLVAFCFSDNTPSWRLMERVGMRREGHSRASTLHRDGTWKDFLSYGLIAPWAIDSDPPA